MKPRSELVDRGVIDPTKEIFGIDIIVYKDFGRVPMQIAIFLSKI